MSTRAVVIDTHIEGKGFYINCDIFLKDLGFELATVFTNDKTIEDLYKQRLTYTVNNHMAFYLSMNGEVDFKVIDLYIREGIYFLDPKDVNTIRLNDFDWSKVGASSVFVLRADGI